MTEAIRVLLDDLFVEWLDIAPQAKPFLMALEAREQRRLSGALMDHLALRTFARPGVDRHVLAAPFLAAGWTSSGTYRFRNKKLRAESFSPPDPALPRVFISELLVDLLPAELGALIDDLLAGGLPADLLRTRPSWAPVAFDTYAQLAAHSPYAAWVVAFGIRANHFTLDVAQLSTFDGVHPLVAWMQGEGLPMNQGGAVQGSRELMLEQASTHATDVEVTFAGGDVHAIPGCYIEVAQRHPDPSTGAPFDGFLQHSADRIFESTDGAR